MKSFFVCSLLLGGIVSMSAGIAAKFGSQSLSRDEMGLIDGGQTYYCCTPLGTTLGCGQCVLLKANLMYFENGMPMFTDVYKQCTNLSMTKVCRQDQYANQPNPMCTKATNLSCGSGVGAYSNNVCSSAVPVDAEGAFGFPAAQIVCNVTYDNATGAMASGVNCTGVAIGVLY